MERDTLIKIHRKISYATLLRFFELQDNKIDDFLLKGIHYIVCNSLGGRNGDSNCRTVLDSNYNLIAEIVKKFEYPPKGF